MELRLFNTLGRRVQRFEPITPGKVGMYTCGPTVYDYQHIGNLRTYLFEDILRRVLEYAGYDVIHVMNVTDVGHLVGETDSGEDKMIKSAREKGRSVWEIAEHYTRVFFRDCASMNIREPTVVCRATDHIDDMIAFVAGLERKGYTYTAGGNVYFDISRFPDYGKMALLSVDDLKAGARIDVDANKKNPLDFVLWFTRSKFPHQAMLWDSPWGRGYPGWHIECSAMSMRCLGERIDIHCGGVDHISVHHTNEIAQSEALTGKKWVNFWMHGEYLLTTGEKMAKSQGNFLTLSALMEEGYEPMDYRYYLLGAHYRTQLQFSGQALNSARNALRRLRERLAQLREEAGRSGAPEEPAEGRKGPTADLTGIGGEGYLRSFLDNAASDLNMPRCLSDLWALLKDDAVPAAARLTILHEMDRILGLGLAEWVPSETELSPEERRLVEERDRARAEKDYAKADHIRNMLEKRGIILEDTPEGSRCRRR